MKIKEEIYNEHVGNGDLEVVHGYDLPLNIIKPDDIIDIHRDEGYYSENNSWDPFTAVIVIREREETENELNVRVEREKSNSNELKKRRYELYLKLKGEFE